MLSQDQMEVIKCAYLTFGGKHFTAGELAPYTKYQYSYVYGVLKRCINKDLIIREFNSKFSITNLVKELIKENIDKNILSNKYTERKAIKSIKKDIAPIVPTEVFKSDDNIILNLNSQFVMIKKEYLEW